MKTIAGFGNVLFKNIAAQGCLEQQNKTEVQALQQHHVHLFHSSRHSLEETPALTGAHQQREGSQW